MLQTERWKTLICSWKERANALRDFSSARVWTCQTSPMLNMVGLVGGKVISVSAPRAVRRRIESEGVR